MRRSVSQVCAAGSGEAQQPVAADKRRPWAALLPVSPYPYPYPHRSDFRGRVLIDWLIDCSGLWEKTLPVLAGLMLTVLALAGNTVGLFLAGLPS